MDTLAPSSLTMTLPTDTGKSSSDGITKENRVTIAGKESGASWEYSVDDGTSWAEGTGTQFHLVRSQLRQRCHPGTADGRGGQYIGGE